MGLKAPAMVVGAASASSPRLLVLEVSMSTSDDDAGAGGAEALLRCVPAAGGPACRVALRGAWARSTTLKEVPRPGDIIRVVLCDAEFQMQPWTHLRKADDNSLGASAHDDQRGDAGLVASENAVIVVVDDNQNLVVRHPDTLISGSAVADSFVCRRKAVLAARNPRGVGRAVSVAALSGSMIHDLFQAIIVLASATKTSTTTSMSGGDDNGADHAPLDVFAVSAAVEDVLAAHVMDVYAANMTLNAARELLMSTLPGILDWTAAFLGPDAAAPVQDGKLKRRMAIDAVRDIEELVWSPIFGIKGKLDATIVLRDVDAPCAENRQLVDIAQDSRTEPATLASRNRASIAPMELKTGSAMGYSGVSHHAQVVLYALLMSDRCNQPVTRGLLSYIRPKGTEKLTVDDATKCTQEHKPWPSRRPSTTAQPTGNGSPPERGSLVNIVRDELVGLVMQRNALASYMLHDADVANLPPMLQGRPSLCGKCFANDSCMIQHRLLEHGTAGASDGSGPDPLLFLEKAGHLSPMDAKYYSFWRRAMAAEEALGCGRRAELWSMSAWDREKTGRCFSGLHMCDVLQSLPTDTRSGILLPGSPRKSFSFKRARMSEGGGLFAYGTMSVGEYVLISVQRWSSEDCTQNGSWANNVVVPAVTSGFLQSVSGDQISVTVDKDLRYWASSRKLSAADLIWRVDAEEIVASYSTAKSSIEALFIADELGVSSKLRRLIVDLCEPQFRSLSEQESRGLQAIETTLASRGMQLNSEQSRALRMYAEAKDYLLLLGMPGTGKTATLAAIVFAAAARNQSVLVCSHTRTAVDNVLSRLLDLGFTDFVRVGQRSSAGDKRIDGHQIELCDGTSTEDLERRLESPAVVATTCLGINHAVFSRRTCFDVVLVDEASQILQPICIGPLLLASSVFVLVGDHYQLPPLMRSSGLGGNSLARVQHESEPGFSVDTARRPGPTAGGIPDDSNPQESLFRRLCEANPSAVVSLVKQYRMARDIMQLCNILVYSGNLTCGTDAVANQMLDLRLGAVRGAPKWLRAVVNPARRHMFLDTDGCGLGGDSGGPPFEQDKQTTTAGLWRRTSERGENNHATSRENMLEARVISACVSALLASGLSGQDMAVLTPFRAQVGLLRTILDELSDSSGGGCSDSLREAVDVCTIDQYQGKDKPCVILSFVRITNNSNNKNNNTPPSTVGPLLKDWRRINVAITRARAKLVMVGSASTVSGGSYFLGSMMQTLREQSALIPVDMLPPPPQQLR
jgi:DNA replication ATP-dependent helicase Dna2